MLIFEQGNKEMITMNQLGKVRRLHYRDGLSLSEIERRTGLTRKTVRSWLKAAEGTTPKYRRRPAEDTKIAPFAVQLTKALEIDARRPKRDRRTALKLFGELQAAGFDGSYSRVSEFVRRWKENGGQALVKAYVPLKFGLGEAFQFDWSEERLVIGGIWRKVIACSTPTSATSPVAGRKGSSRRMCRIAGGGSGRTLPRSASARSPNSTSGCWHAVVRYGRNCATPSTRI